VAGIVVYDKDKTTFRSEIEPGAAVSKPDMIYLNGYTPDCTVLMKELFKGRLYRGKVAQGYAVNAKLLGSLPREVTDGTYTATPSPAVESAGYNRLARALGTDDLDPYSCQCHDHISLVRAGHSPTRTARRPAPRSATMCGRSPRATARRSTAPSKPEAARPRQGHQLRGRQRTVRLHRRGRHPRLQRSGSIRRSRASSSS